MDPVDAADAAFLLAQASYDASRLEASLALSINSALFAEYTREMAASAESAAHAHAPVSHPAPWLSPLRGRSSLELYRHGNQHLPSLEVDADRSRLVVPWTRFDHKPSIPWRKVQHCPETFALAAAARATCSSAPHARSGSAPAAPRTRSPAIPASGLTSEVPPQLRRWLTPAERRLPPRAAHLLSPAVAHPRPFLLRGHEERPLFSTYAAGRPILERERAAAARFALPERVLYNPRAEGREPWRKPTSPEGCSLGLFSSFPTEECFLLEAQRRSAQGLELRFASAYK